MSTDYHAKFFAYDLTRQGGKGIDRLSQSLFDACVDLNPHQVEAAVFALRSPLSKGALLADEVGLGKTIEAGLVISQYWAERKRALLVVCPASLRKQWQIELEDKFNLPCTVVDSKLYRKAQKEGNPNPFNTKQIVITSLHYASRMAEDVKQVQWDLVVIDEAHKLRNSHRASNKIGQSIRWALEDRRKLLLTATPLQNSLTELYGITTLIDDQLFGGLPTFRTLYANSDGDLDDLRARLNGFCKRTLRKDVLEFIQYTQRKLTTIRFRPNDEEHRLYESVSAFLQRRGTYALPSCMGLVNIGRNEGSQIIQLFGRGVRLKGLDFCLKRSGHIPDVEHPQYIAELETLNVFGIRADYMQAFNDYIEEEDVDSEKKTEIIILPTLENLARTDLKVILPKRDMPDFKREVKPVFNRDDRIHTKVSADWYGRLDSRTTRYDLHSMDENHFNETSLKPENRLFLDYNKLYLDLLHFKKQNAMYNLEISKDAIRQLLSQDDWYVLCIPNHLLEFSNFGKVDIWQEIAADLLQKYCRKFYNFHKDEFEAPYQEYRTIQQVMDNPDDRHNKQFLQNLRIEYRAAIEKSQEQLIQDLNTVSERLQQGQLQEYECASLSVFNFDKHLYQPLIHVAQGSVGISVKPTHLNKHEKKFIEDLKIWCQANADEFLNGKELYVLRNQSRGKGISFFEEGNFYPDFIMWLLDDDKQYITFVDPHGLRHARSFDDSKVRFHETIKQIERERLQDDSVVLNSFILSPTRYIEISHWAGGAGIQMFHDHNVLFMDDDQDYISFLFGRVYGNV